MLRTALPNCKIDAVEPTDSYIKDFGLQDVYHHVYNMSIDDYVTKHPEKRYDVVIIGDMLEHLYRSKAFDYLDFLLYRSGWVLVVWPTNFVQDAWEGNQYECHRSNFKLADFANVFQVEFYAKKFLQHHEYDPLRVDVNMHYCVMKGVGPYRHESFIT